MKYKPKKLAIALGAISLILVSAYALQQLPTGHGVDARCYLGRASIGRNGPLADALRKFEKDTGRFPTTHEGLTVLFVSPVSDRDQWRGPYLDGLIEELTDPWGESFVYQYPGTHNLESFDLWTKGRNRVSEPDDPDSDDIRNWGQR